METKIKIDFIKTYEKINQLRLTSDQIFTQFKVSNDKITDNLNYTSGHTSYALESTNKSNLAYIKSLVIKTNDLIRFIEDAAIELEKKDNELSSQIVIKRSEI